jgi:hypothetical protein
MPEAQGGRPTDFRVVSRRSKCSLLAELDIIVMYANLPRSAKHANAPVLNPYHAEKDAATVPTMPSMA